MFGDFQSLKPSPDEHPIQRLVRSQLGFVHGPALLGIVAGSVLTAPIGARAAHRMPVVMLRRIFAVLLYVLATKMLLTYGWPV